MKIFLATHGKMAGGMASSLDILLGGCVALTTYDAYLPGEDDLLDQSLETFFKNTPAEETKLLVSDIYGGSVNRRMVCAAGGKENTYVVSGITLGLLMEFASMTDENPTAEDIDEVIAEARENTVRVELEESEEQEKTAEDDFF